MPVTDNLARQEFYSGDPRARGHRPVARAREPARRSMRMVSCVLVILAVAPAGTAHAEDNPLTAHSKFLYGGLKAILLRAAERMPEENYTFKPTPAVRSFGQIVGHVADLQYTYCSRVLGEKDPAPKIEQTKTAKADLVAALKGSFAYCEKAYDGMTDAIGVQMIKAFRADMPKLGVLTIVSLHGTEHYGNLVTYMRMNNQVPPTSEQGFNPVPKK